MSTPAGSPVLGNELPGQGLLSDYQINQWLFGDNLDPADRPKPQMRIWLSGVIEYDPYDTPLQMRPFASWRRSRLTEQVAPVGSPPPGYTGIIENHPERPYPPSMYLDYLDELSMV